MLGMFVVACFCGALVIWPAKGTIFIFGARMAIMGTFTVLYIYTPEVRTAAHMGPSVVLYMSGRFVPYGRSTSTCGKIYFSVHLHSQSTNICMPGNIPGFVDIPEVRTSGHAARSTVVLYNPEVAHGLKYMRNLPDFGQI